MERCVLSCLVPATLEVKERMDRLINMYSSLDAYATRYIDVELCILHYMYITRIHVYLVREWFRTILFSSFVNFYPKLE